jgi:hypothetical protein
MLHRALLPSILALSFSIVSARAAVNTYGDKDLDGFGYPAGVDPTTGATLEGLATDAVTLASTAYGHDYPFAPDASDYPGTDQIFVGSVQTASLDGYSMYAGRLNGPQVITMDYSSLIPAGQNIATLTLGLGADDFQFPAWGDPFTVSINGHNAPTVANELMSLNESGPFEQFVSFGIDPTWDISSHVLTLSIDEQGDGGDGWSLDFLTVGVTTAPEPGAAGLLALGGMGLLVRRGRQVV